MGRSFRSGALDERRLGRSSPRTVPRRVARGAEPVRRAGVLPRPAVRTTGGRRSAPRMTWRPGASPYRRDVRLTPAAGTARLWQVCPRQTPRSPAVLLVIAVASAATGNPDEGPGARHGAGRGGHGGLARVALPGTAGEPGSDPARQLGADAARRHAGLALVVRGVPDRGVLGRIVLRGGAGLVRRWRARGGALAAGAPRPRQRLPVRRRGVRRDLAARPGGTQLARPRHRRRAGPAGPRRVRRRRRAGPDRPGAARRRRARGERDRDPGRAPRRPRSTATRSWRGSRSARSRTAAARRWPRCAGCSACCATDERRAGCAPQPGLATARGRWSTRCGRRACRSS